MVNMPSSAADLIAAYNEGRDASRLALKYEAMHNNPFSFLRGTAHLFHQRLKEAGAHPGGPTAWICGDLHLENFGTYLGGNGLTYFDINDFDECALAPCSWDLLRLVTSILVAAPLYEMPRNDALAVATSAIDAYRQALASGKALWIERRTADGVIGALIDSLKHRDAEKFVLKRTVGRKGTKLDTASDKMEVLASAAERKAVTTFVQNLRTGQDATESYKVLDVAYRIAGTGSLGIKRYVVLAERADAVDQTTKILLDLKAALPSSVAPASPATQPAWPTQGERIVTIQTQAQAVPPALLRGADVGGGDFVLKELQPSADRLDLDEVAKDPAQFTSVVATMATLAAWSQLRTAGRRGAPSADDLAAFGKDKAVLKPLLGLARTMERATLDDWATYCRDYDAGRFQAVLAARDTCKTDEAA